MDASHRKFPARRHPARRQPKPPARRHRKVPVDQIECVSRHVIAKMANEVRVLRIAGGVYHAVRTAMRHFLVVLVVRALAAMPPRKTLSPVHVKRAVDDVNALRR